MRVKDLIKKYFYSPFFKHFLMYTNILLFTAISYISLALDVRPPFNVINIALVALFIVATIIFLIINKIRPRINVFVICVTGLMFCYILSYAINGFGEFPKTPVLITVFSLFLFLWLDANRKDIHFYLLGFLIASWMFLITFAVFEHSAVLHPSFSKRVGVSLGNENDVARHLVFAFLINVYYIYACKNKYLKAIFVFMCVLTTYFVFLTGSISNLLLLLLSIFIAAFYISQKKTGIFITISSIVLIGVIITLIFTVSFLSPIKDRILSIFETVFKTGDVRPDSSAIGRYNAMVFGFRLFCESPLFGNGYNSVVNSYMIMAHNNISEIGADYGIFALLFEELLIIYPVLRDEKAVEKGKLFTAIFGMYVFVIQMFLVVFNSKVELIVLPLMFIMTNEDVDLVPSFKSFFQRWKKDKVEVVEQ